MLTEYKLMTRARSSIAVKLLLALFAFWWTLKAEAQEWHVFEPAGLNFSIELPAVPTVTEEQFGDRKVTNLSLSVGDLSIDISHDPIFDGTSFENFLVEYKRNLIALFKLPLLEERVFKLNGYPAADLAYGSAGHFVQIRVVAPPTFSLIVIVSDGIPTIDSPIVRRLLASLSMK